MSEAPINAARTAPAAARNRGPILEVLNRVLPPQARVLEIASGTGEHTVHFAAARPDVVWQPTDRDPEAITSIAAHRALAGLFNVLPPLELDVTAATWPVAQADAVISINMIHIAPWEAARGLMAGAARVLVPGGVLVLYGPFKEGGRHTAPSNAAFDASLRARDPAWGVRDLEDVAALAARYGIRFSERVAMPANNLTLVFVKA